MTGDLPAIIYLPFVMAHIPRSNTEALSGQRD
jgi:hypothetical protein